VSGRSQDTRDTLRCMKAIFIALVLFVGLLILNALVSS